jgi:hypothetical protein
MLEACRQDARNIDPAVWRDYFGGFAAEGCGPEEGALPFRVWQLWDIMVAALRDKDVRTFVGAGGVMAHYVGDASQPLHSSYLHHGRLPMLDRPSGKFPVRHASKAYTDFKKTREAKVHGIYEERMLEIDALAALEAIDAALAHAVPDDQIDNGWEAARVTFDLMADAHHRLSPAAIIDADDPSLSETERAKRLWAHPTVKRETIRSLAESTIALARLWKSAWRKGNGNAIAAKQLRAFKESEIKALYRPAAKFAPALTLDQMAQSGNFVVP